MDESYQTTFALVAVSWIKKSQEFLILTHHRHHCYSVEWSLAKPIIFIAVNKQKFGYISQQMSPFKSYIREQEDAERSG